MVPLKVGGFSHSTNLLMIITPWHAQRPISKVSLDLKCTTEVKHHRHRHTQDIHMRTWGEDSICRPKGEKT